MFGLLSFRQPEDMRYGSYKDGKWSGMIGDLLSGVYISFYDIYLLAFQLDFYAILLMFLSL